MHDCFFCASVTLSRWGGAWQRGIFSPWNAAPGVLKTGNDQTVSLCITRSVGGTHTACVGWKGGRIVNHWLALHLLLRSLRLHPQLRYVFCSFETTSHQHHAEICHDSWLLFDHPLPLKFNTPGIYILNNWLAIYIHSYIHYIYTIYIYNTCNNIYIYAIFNNI